MSTERPPTAEEWLTAALVETGSDDDKAMEWLADHLVAARAKIRELEGRLEEVLGDCQ